MLNDCTCSTPCGPRLVRTLEMYSPLAYFLLDAEGTIACAGDRWMRITGLSGDESEGLILAKMIGSHEGVPERHELEGLEPGRSSPIYSARILLPSGWEFWIDYQLTRSDFQHLAGLFVGWMWKLESKRLPR